MNPLARRLRAGAVIASAALAAALLAMPAAAVDVGVSVSISQPGVHGRIDIGRFPQPQVIVAQPVLVQHPPAARPGHAVQPVYMWVPPGHRKNWKKHCRQYGACGVPVYFVRHDWYDRHVKPRHVRDRDHDHDRDRRGYRDERGHRDDRGPRDRHHGPGRGKGRDD